MRKARFLLIAVVVIALIAIAGTAAAAGGRNFRAHLASENEVAAVPVESLAQGQATFQLSADETTLDYSIIAANIENITMAHIHRGAPGSNGPIVVWLYPEAPPPSLIPGAFDGVLATGSITAADLVGPLAGMTLDDLLDLLESGNAYVNIHTSQYPSGEIRGPVH